MLVFTFAEKDLLNSPLYSGDIRYTLSTTTGFWGRKATTLASPGVFSSRALGVINWRKERFKIGEVHRKWSDLKHRTGLFSR